MQNWLERCSSGLRGTPGKRVYDKIVSRVRIPISPQENPGPRGPGFFFGKTHPLFMQVMQAAEESGRQSHSEARPLGGIFGVHRPRHLKSTWIFRWCIIPQNPEKRKATTWKSDDCFSFVSGYCDSNTGPSGPKPDALANCATPRLFELDCKDTFNFWISKI